MQAVDTNTAYIERGSPWENGYIESFNARLRDELLDGEIFYSLREAQTVIEVGGVTTTVSGRTRPRCSCPRSPRGRLRYVERLRRPRFMARKSNAQANVKDRHGRVIHPA